MTEEKKLKRILIFDDDGDLRKLLLAYLGKLFPDVELEEYDPLTSGEPGESFDWSRIDVLVLDYFLCIDGVTGLDILHKNRKNPAFPATIMLTGAGNEEVAVRALKAGVYDYLRKQSLNKQELHDSIIKAFKDHHESVKRTQENTQHGKAFNKSLFYQQLEFHKDLPGYRDRALLYIELDDHAEIAEREGVILRDNIVRYVAKNTFEIFRVSERNPSITRLGEACIALLVDMPNSTEILNKNMASLLKHLEKKEYNFDGRKISFSVSIGVVVLEGDGESKEIILEKAGVACEQAGLNRGNSFAIFGESEGGIVHPQADTDHEDSGGTKPDTTGDNASPSGALKNKSEADISSPPPSSMSRHDTDQEAKPKKSLEELKAELARAKAAAAGGIKKEQKPGEAKDSAAEDSGPSLGQINKAGQSLKQAFDEKRIIQTFQPVISFSSEETNSSEEDIHYVSLQHIDKDGKVYEEEEIRKDISTPEFQKFVDRWTLREIIGYLINKRTTADTFILRLSAASLADAGFFNWLRKLLTGLDSRNPGKHIILEIDSNDLSTLAKQASALISFLRKSHDFRFALGNVGETEDIIRYTGMIHFDFIRCILKNIMELKDLPADSGENGNEQEKSPHNQFDLLKSRNTRIIVDEILDATSLTESISFGTDFAMGEFIGEAVTQLDDSTNIETFEIV